MPTARWLFNGTNNAFIPSSGLAPNVGETWKLLGDDTYRKYSTAQAYQGSSSIVSSLSDPGISFSVDAGGPLSDYTPGGLYFDFFYYLPAAPASDMHLIGGAYSTPNGCFISSDRRLKMKDSAGTVQVQSATNVVPLNEWFRVRAFFNQNLNLGLTSVTIWKAPYLSQNDLTGGGYGEVTVSHSLAAEGYLILSAGSGYIDDLVISTTTGASFADLGHSAMSDPAPPVVRRGWGVVR